MSAAVTVIFPEASRRGGVERITLDLCNHLALRHPTSWLGIRSEGLDAAVRELRVPPAPSRVSEPLWFRRASGRAATAGTTTVTMGAVCPPGDVIWVHSVHLAYLRSSGSVRLGRFTLGAGVRRLLPRHLILLALERRYFASRLPKLYLCTSQREADDIVELYGVSRSLTRVIPNGFDPDVFNVDRVAGLREARRASLGYAPADVVLLLAANEWHRKGLDVLLSAVARVASPRLKLLLVGRRDPEAYAGEIRRLGLDEVVHYAGGTDDMAPYYAAADVFVLPTTYEPFGLVVVEALACGVPVIVSALAGAAPALDSGAGLLLADPQDVAELAAALTSALDDDTRALWAGRAREAADPYRWPAILDQVEAAILEVAAGTSPGA